MAEGIIPEELVSVLLDQLKRNAMARPDLLPNAGRALTYLGRVVYPEQAESPQQMLKRFPQSELETGGTAMQASDLLKAAIPLSKAAIPFSYWRRAPAEVKASLTYALNEQPELMQRALASPDRILPGPEARLGILGSAERLTPNTIALNISPPPVNVTRLSFPGHIEEALAGTGTHELTHILQNPRVLATRPEDAATIGTLLDNIIGERNPWLNRASLANSIRDLNFVDMELSNLPEAVKKLAVPGSYARSTTKYGGLGGPEMLKQEALSRLTMDEGLATLAESARDPRADSLLRLLAERLGLGVTQKK